MKVAKYAELFYSFLTTLDEVEKYVELIQKIPDEKTMMQWWYYYTMMFFW